MRGPVSPGRGRDSLTSRRNSTTRSGRTTVVIHTCRRPLPTFVVGDGLPKTFATKTISLKIPKTLGRLWVPTVKTFIVLNLSVDPCREGLKPRVCRSPPQGSTVVWTASSGTPKGSPFSRGVTPKTVLWPRLSRELLTDRHVTTDHSNARITKVQNL